MKRGTKDNIQINKNYFSITKEAYDIIKMVLQEMFSKEISDLAIDLLYNNNSTIFDIQSRLKLSFENVRNYLIIMLQNNLIKKTSTKRKDVVYQAYDLNHEQILNILLFPRTLKFIEKKYGFIGKLIFEQFMEFGVLNTQQIIEQIQNKSKNINSDTMKGQIMNLLHKFHEENVIMFPEKVIDDEKEGDNCFDLNHIKTKNNTIKQKEKNIENSKKKGNKKGKNQKSNKKKEINLNEDDDDEDEDESNNIDNKEISQNDYSDINNKHFYINFEQIFAEFKSEIIIDYINKNISHQTALLAAILLKNYKISSFSIGKTSPIQIDTLINNNKSLTYKQVEEILGNGNEFIIKSGDDQIYLDIKKVTKTIKTKIIQQIILSKFSKEHLRVYNLLYYLGALDGKNIMDLCLIAPKKINYVINQLFQEGFIQTDTINQNGNNMIFYSVDEYKSAENILKMDYKIINNYKAYYSNQLKDIKNKFRDNKKQKEDLEKLTYIIDQICENIIIMEYF